VAFTNWILTTVSIALIFPVFIYLEEWKLLTNVLYRLTFGNWKRIVNECDEMKYKQDVKKREEEERKKKHKETIRKSKMHDVKIVDVEEEIETKKTATVCQTCGEKIDTETSYCPKCGSYIGH
jgi:transposase